MGLDIFWYIDNINFHVDTDDLLGVLSTEI